MGTHLGGSRCVEAVPYDSLYRHSAARGFDDFVDLAGAKHFGAVAFRFVPNCPEHFRFAEAEQRRFQRYLFSVASDLLS
jgi:hypothetical protein